MSDARAIILAAGMGTRLVAGQSIPKPMVEVAGVPLLVRVLRALEAAGMKEVAIIVGYRREVIVDTLAREKFAMELTYFENDEFEKPNGTSLLKARSFVRGPTFLMMSDHLWSPTLLERVWAYPLEAHQSLLGIDKRIDRCFDLDDATKVATDGDRIRRIGKMIPEYDAIDTGVFRITPALIEALVAVEGPAGCSLSQGVQALSERGDMRVVDVNAATWIDVDTPEAHAIAERLIRRYGDHLDAPAELGAQQLADGAG